MNTLSIDFGTSFCAAAYIGSSGVPCPVEFGINQDNGSCYKIPTVIQYATDLYGEERKIIGEIALSNLVQSCQLDSSIISRIKTELRENSGYIINGKCKQTVTIVADILGHIKECAEKRSGREFKDLILTHPAQFASTKINLLHTAANQCGFSSVTMLEEPKAAAYAFIKKHQIPNQKGAIVFDYGGGTIDITYLWIENPKKIDFKFKPVSREQCGGEYIDLELHNHFFSSFYPESSSESVVSPILLDHCKRLKIGFGSDDDVKIAANKKVVIVKRQEFENIVSSRVSVAISLLKDVIKTCKDNNNPVDYVFMNGGSSRLGIIKDTITGILPEAQLLPYDEDDIAVAIGAQLYLHPDNNAVNENNEGGKVSSFNPELQKIRERYKKSKI